MNELSPSFVAGLAKNIYLVVESDSINEALDRLNRLYSNAFRFTDNNLIKGKTGIPRIIKCRTAFGFTLIGQGQFKGHAFILFRGTKFLADWLTNLSAGVSSSACGAARA